MKTKTLILLQLFLLFLIQNCFSQNNFGVKSRSMGDASATFNDVWSFHNNPGATGNVDKFGVGVSYQNMFFINNLSIQSVACIVPLKFGVLSAGGSMESFSNFQSYKAGVGYSLKLSKRFFVGVQLNYLGNVLPSFYGSKHSMCADAGLYVKLTDKLKLGVVASNLNRAKRNDFQNERFKSVMRIGLGYTFSDRLLASVEVEKDANYPVQFKCGMEYRAVQQFYIRGGFKMMDFQASFGFEYQFNVVHLGIGTSYSPKWGVSPMISLIYIGDKE